MVQRAPDQPVRAELPPQRSQLRAAPAVQDGFGHAARSAEARDHSTDCRDFHLGGRITHQVDIASAHSPAYRRWIPVRRRVGRGDVYLVGDAAAQVKVTTIGGVITGFRGARGVAEAILNGGRSAELRALRRELGTHWLIRRALHHFQQVDYSRLVDLLDASARESLGEITRDDAVRLLWSVARRQPRLLLLGLRG